MEDDAYFYADKYGDLQVLFLLIPLIGICVLAYLVSQIGF